MPRRVRRAAKPQATSRALAPAPLQEQEQEQAPAAVEEPALTPVLDRDAIEARHAALLAAPRFAGATSGGQRVQLMRHLQRGYGNAHVARVMARLPDGVSAAGLLQRDCPPAVVDRPPVAPEQDPGFRATKAKLGQVAAQEKQHPPAKAKAAEAQAAAVGPANEVASQAAAGQVEKMGQQQPGAFDKKAFVAAVRKAIEAAAPKNLDEAEKYKSSGKAGQVKGQVAGLVKGSKEAAEQDIKETAKAAPDPGGARPKPVTPMKPEAAGPAPGPVGAAAAMPKPTPADEVSLKHDQCQTDSQMKEAGVTEEQLKKSNEPQFEEALASKKQADAHTKAAPPAYRAEEGAALGQARGDAATAAAGGVAGMHAGRGGALAQIMGQKGTAKAKDEAGRAKVAADLEAIYGKTKADVAKILDGLGTKVDTAFEAGDKAAREAMESHVDSKTTDFKLKRYLLQPGGALLWIKDQFSKPPELDAIVNDGVKLFLGRMDGVIDQIADIVGKELTAAKARIAQGRQEIKQHVAGLPRHLQQVGQEAATGMQAKFDQLDQDVADKQQSLVDGLAEKYVAARDAANERANAMRDANKGLWEKAKDAVGGAIETIKKLKEMLTGVLAKAAGVIDTIIKDPIGFLGNLVSAIKMGLQQFVGNIATHLKKGLLGWLFGALAEAGIQLPESFDLKGILGLVLQLLGLTYANIRGRAVKMVGEKVVGGLEKTVEVFKTLVTEGPAGLWKFIKDKLASLKDQVMEQIQDFVITKVITAGITWLVSMLNPASAFIKACKAIYDVVMFFVERGSQIMGLVNSILDGIGAIAAGALGGAANLVEQSLAKAVPVAISFLASLLGLGGISGKIRSVIEKIQKPINGMIDKLVGGVVKGFKKVAGGIKGLFGKKEKPADAESEQKVKAGLAQIDQEEAHYLKNGKIREQDAKKVAAKTKADHPVFASLTVKDTGSRWDYSYTIARTDKKGEEKAEGGDDDKWKRAEQLRSATQDVLYKQCGDLLGKYSKLRSKYDPSLGPIKAKWKSTDEVMRGDGARDLVDMIIEDFVKIQQEGNDILGQIKADVAKIDPSAAGETEKPWPHGSITILGRRAFGPYQVEVHVDERGPHIHLDRGTDTERYINLKGVTAAAGAAELPGGLQGNATIEGAIATAIERWEQETKK